MPAVFDRYSNSFLKIYFPIPAGREDEIARKVLITHLQSGNSYGIQLKEKHCKFPQPELGPWVEGSTTVGADWKAARARGLGAPAGTEAVDVLVLQHIACEPPGVFEDVLRRARRRRSTGSSSTRASRCPDWRDFDAIVAMGGPMSVNDEAELPVARATRSALIAETVRAGTPFWGVVPRRAAARLEPRRPRLPGRRARGRAAAGRDHTATVAPTRCSAAAPTGS